MALYLGSSHKLKINIGNIAYCLNAIFDESIEPSIRLWSSDNYILADANGVYLLPRDSEIIIDNIILSSDGYILKDYNGLYLTSKEDK